MAKLITIGGSAIAAAVNPDVEVQQEGYLVGIREKLNFIAGVGTTLSVEDDPTNGRVNITIGAAAGGGGFGKYREITIDHSKVGGGLSGYAFLFTEIGRA